MNELDSGLSNVPYDSAEAIGHLSTADPRLGLLITLVGDFKFDYRPAQDLFEALCQAIVHQQLSGKAAKTIYQRFVGLLAPETKPLPAAVQQLDFDALRGVGLSRAKTLAILDLAEKCVDGTVPDNQTIRTMTDDEIHKSLTSVRGIGPWTVEMLLMFRLGRPDVLPATDLGVRKGFALTFGTEVLPEPADILKYGERWQPYRSVASWYLWRALELDEGALPPP